MGTALWRHVSDRNIANNPPAYGVPADSVNGMDVVAVERAVHNEAELVRETSKPRFLELKTYRFRAHSMYDAELYRSKEEVDEHKKDDPIEGFQKRLLKEGLVEQSDIDTIEDAAAKEIADAVEFAEQGEWEPIEDITRHTYARNLS
jgi:pyruvate dehydrogenase E1 component beta subunit/2-oxoisovalerate dehydrogenase E1 component